MEKHVVCMIDNDDEMIDLVTLILSPYHFAVRGATNGRAGIEMVRREQPALVLLDVMMPDMDGWQVLAELRADETTRHIPVALLSGARPTAELGMGGVDGVITKPFGPTELLAGVRRLLRD